MGGFEYAKLIESIKRFGFTDPVTVRALNGHFQMIDGEHRWRAARDLGLMGIDYMDVSPISDKEAIALGITLNELKGRHDARELGELLKDLLEGSDPDEVLQGLPFTEDALKGLVGLKSFDWSQFDNAQRAETENTPNPSPKKGMRWVERTFRLPPDVNEVLNDALAKVKDQEVGIEDWQALEMIAADYLGG